MNPIEIGTGKSFKGLAAYLLHDPNRAATAERVGWVQSFNLDDAAPDRAWRLMAATAMSADQLKEAAGIKKGKAAKNTAYHFALTFNPEDQPAETVQRAAVEGALKSLGLDGYQALAISHTDTPHAHVHVMVNLINPENGLSAASKQPDGRPALMSNTQRKLSQWAQRFEREHGLTITEGRLENANKRAQGEKVEARRDPRNVYEQKKNETTDRRRDLPKRQFEEQARELTAEGRAMHERHSIEWEALKASYGAEKKARDLDHKRAIPALIAAVKELHKPRWPIMFKRQRDELRDFERADRTAIGRIWHAAAVFRDRAQSGDALGGFVAAFSHENRRAIVQRKHDRERAKMAQQIRDEISRKIQSAKRDQANQRYTARLRYIAACDDLKGHQTEAREVQRERWRSYNAARNAALSTVRTQQRGIERGQHFGRGRGLEPN